MTKIINFNNEAKDKLQKGINKLADAVTCTLGPNGRNVLIEKPNEFPSISSTKDGVSVAKSIFLEDKVENMGAQIIKEASLKTAKIAGDGTTTSTLLAQNLFNEGYKNITKGSNVVEVIKGMQEALNQTKTHLTKISKNITDNNSIKQVAYISSNNDEKIGVMISEAMDKVGIDGLVSIEESKSGEDSLELVEGMQFDKGYKSHHFVTDTKNMQVVLEDPYILITDKKLTTIKEILPILQKISSESKSLLIIADDIEGEALATLVVNKTRGTIKVAAVKAPGFGDRKEQLLEDIAIMTGGKVISDKKGMKLTAFDMDWFGSCRILTLTKDITTIIDGKGEIEEITKRAEDIKSQIDNAKSDYDKESLQDRLGKLIGGVAIINVGGSNEIEIKEKKDRVEDALCATKAALEEGVLPGGGVALLKTYFELSKNNNVPPLSKDQQLGFDIVMYALKSPIMKILDNGGEEWENVFHIANTIKNNENIWYGYDAKNKTFGDLYELGIIDPTKVTRIAIENAVSVASILLLTECTINESEDIKEENPMDFGM